MFCSLVLLIKTINTFLSVYGVIFHLFQEILTKKNMAEAEVAEAETEKTPGGVVGQTPPGGRPPLEADPRDAEPPGSDIKWRPLQRSVRILLECIPVH